jgi:hypothetical protein
MVPTLTLNDIIAGFQQRWASAPDARKPNNNTRYQMADGLLSAFSVFLMQSSSFLAHQRLMQSKRGRNNAASLFRVERIPSDSQIRNLLDPLSVTYFHADFWRLWDELQARQQLPNFRSELGGYLVAMDGVTHFSSEKISCPECLKRQDREGVPHFYHSAITPALVKPGMKQVLPLPPEFIVPQDGHEKQDCERSAAKRWLGAHAAHLAVPIIYLGDDLYANQPLCQAIIETYRQSFIFVCKPDSHTGLYEWLAWLERNGAVATLTHRRWNGKHGEIWTYRFVNQVPLRNGHDALSANWCELVIAHETSGDTLYRNAFITNLVITPENVAAIVAAGRTRWKIENENNNTLKTKGYHLEHNFGHGRQHLANVLVSLNLLAFLVHTIQELCEPLYQTLRQALGARKNFFNDLRALTRYWFFEDWEALFRFMAEGLEIPWPSS